MRTAIIAFLPVALGTHPEHNSRANKPVYWLLAGDSTTAPKGGWGDAFLSTTVASGSSGHNYGHSGATTKSFRSSDWSKVVKDIGTYKSQYSVCVTIQFGHNDQKNNSGVSVSEFKANLARFAAEATSAGATPILLTPLTRRTFDKSTHRVIENLVDQREATIDAALASSLKWIDLNKASTDYVNAIGQQAASKYNLESGDWTHLNPWGGVVFARIVSDLLVAKYPGDFEAVTQKNETLSSLIKAGKPA